LKKSYFLRCEVEDLCAICLKVLDIRKEDDDDEATTEAARDA
jgi:hypothetical protein